MLDAAVPQGHLVGAEGPGSAAAWALHPETPLTLGK